MPLVVPVLRFFLVFLNVYETFKTLKPPPPSARRGGQPSGRAISQRKRDLKGCLAIWVVWCCYAAYERTFDRVVSIFLPFYSEIKSVFLLFLVLTRAKGAEPLFLHVLRPLIKPYVAVVDPMLELTCDIGDFVFALLQVPLDYFLSSSWFPSWRTTSESEAKPGELSSGSRHSLPDTESSTHTRNPFGIPVLSDHGVVRTSRIQQKGSGSTRSVSDPQRTNDGIPVTNSRTPRDYHSKSGSTTSLPAYSEHPSYAPPRYSQTLSRHNGHQIWHPPASAYAALCGEPSISPRDPGTAPEYHSPEWRTYPAFPSAYPPTPLPAPAPLPSPAAVADCSRRLPSDSAYPPIPEDEQDFGDMLERPREGRTGSAHSSSNGDEIPLGANGYESGSDATRQPDEDTLLDDSMCSSEAGLSEDDFGASLRTPYRSPAAIPSVAYSSSVDSLTTALTTANYVSPLRTKTSSESLSSGSSLAGRKRNHGTLRGGTRQTLPIASSRNATLRGKSVPPPIHQDVFQSSMSEGEDERGVDDDYNSIKTKRQRVLDPVKRKSTVRPSIRGGNARKTTLAARGSRPVSTVHEEMVQPKAGSVITSNATAKGRKPIPTSRQVARGGAQGIIKSSSTSSQSGTLRGRAQ